MSKPFPILQEEDGTRLGTLTHIAELLGVTPSRVHGWSVRRASSGFPEPVRQEVFNGRTVDVFDLDDVRVWHLFYVPHRGRPVPGGAAEIGRALGVSTKQVSKWVERRASNGCPELAEGEDAWKAWHAQYSPQRNQHTLRRSA